MGILIGNLIGRYPVSQPTQKTNVEVTIKKDSLDTVYIRLYKPSKAKLNDSTLMAELVNNDIQHPEIVLAQAKLETGNYTSKVCKTCNNLFGLRRGNRYRKYAHWSESVAAYKNLIQCRYKGGDYFKFLETIGYASDPIYTDKLRDVL